MVEFNLLIFHNKFMVELKLHNNKCKCNNSKFILVTVLHLQELVSIQAPLKTKGIANQTLCNSVWTLYRHHTLMGWLKNKLIFKTNNRAINKAQEITRDLIKRYSWSKRINSILKGWRSKHKISRSLVLSHAVLISTREIYSNQLTILMRAHGTALHMAVSTVLIEMVIKTSSNQINTTLMTIWTL